MTRYTLLAAFILLPMFGSAAPAADARGDLVAAKLKAARLVYEAMAKGLREGGEQVNADRLHLWSRRWMEAQRDASPKKADRIAALEAHRDRMKELRKTAEQRYKAGQSSHADVLAADFYIAEAELWLTEANKAK